MSILEDLEGNDKQSDASDLPERHRLLRQESLRLQSDHMMCNCTRSLDDSDSSLWSVERWISTTLIRPIGVHESRLAQVQDRRYAEFTRL